jgi:hypothetical protein
MVGFDEQKASEARARYEALTRRIQALDVDIGRTLDLLQRQVLRERREELSQERELVVQEMIELPAPPGPENNEEKDEMMEREDLKMLYDMRNDVTLLRREVEELRVLITQVRENCAPVPGTLPPALLNVMIISGLLIMAALIVITLRMVVA